MWICLNILTLENGRSAPRKEKSQLLWSAKLYIVHYIWRFSSVYVKLLYNAFCSQDKQVKGTVYRITGSIPASNFIQFPRTSTQSLGLTGRFLYCLFRPIAGKYFVVHVDLATDDGLTIRVSFSNMFKEFKSTSTWLQFPFVSSPPPGSVDEATLSEAGTITSEDCVNINWYN